MNTAVQDAATFSPEDQPAADVIDFVEALPQRMSEGVIPYVFVLPAFALAYLVAGRAGWWTRIWHLLAAGGAVAVALLLSLKEPLHSGLRRQSELQWPGAGYLQAEFCQPRKEGTQPAVPDYRDLLKADPHGVLTVLLERDRKSVV